MVEIELYKPNSIDAKISFPTEWNELLLNEILYVSICLNTDGFNKNELFIFLLKNRMKHVLKLSEKKASNIILMLDIEQMAIEMDSLLAFLLDDVQLNKNPFEKLGKYTGPTDDFNNLTCGEYEDAEIHFLNYLEDNNNMAHLYRLASVLWREKDFNYLDANNKIIDTTACYAFMQKQPVAVLLAIYLWYMSCRNNLPIYFPLVYGSGDEHKTKSIDLMAFSKMIHYGAGAKNGTRLDIRKMNLKEFLFDCQLTAEQSEDVL